MEGIFCPLFRNLIFPTSCQPVPQIVFSLGTGRQATDLFELENDLFKNAHSHRTPWVELLFNSCLCVTGVDFCLCQSVTGWERHRKWGS